MGKMHVGSWDGKSKAWNLFDALIDAHPAAIPANKLARAVRTTCLSTHISALRALLYQGESLWTVVCDRKRHGSGMRYSYRLAMREGL